MPALKVILATAPPGVPDDADLAATISREEWCLLLEQVTDPISLALALQLGGGDFILLQSDLAELTLQQTIAIVQRSPIPDLPVIVLSGVPGEGRAADAILAGATDYVLLPDLSRLRSAAGRILENHPRRRRPVGGANSDPHPAAEDLLGARRRLGDLAGIASLEEFMRAAVDATERFTGSGLGFFHFIDGQEKQITLQVWSTRALRELGAGGIPAGQLPIAEAGIWADCLETRAPILHNNFDQLPHRRGLLESRAPVVRELVVPLVRGGSVFAILGVANKSGDYTERDVDVVESFASIIADLVERKRAESALRASEERVRAVLDCVPAGIFLEARGRFAYLNQAATRLLGADSADDLLDRSVFDRFAPDQRERIAARFLRLYEDGVPMPTTEGTCRRLDGTTFEVEVSAVAFHQGGHRGALVFFNDTTGRRLLEAQFRQAQKMEAVGRLASGVAHDFNNILTTIFIHLELLSAHPGLDPASRETVRELNLEARRAGALTRQLLLFGRRSSIQYRPTDLGDLVENMLRMLRRLIGEQIVLHFHRAQGLRPVTVDQAMMEQVLLNLTVNARDAMPRGGQLAIHTESLTLAQEQAALRPGARAGEFVVLQVTDSGCGMDATVLKHLFEPFYTTKPPGRGTGLGLATVYSIVQQHQGWIEVESTVDRGSCFRVLLPASHASTAPAESPADLRTTGAEGAETILFVEDENAVRRSVGIYLRRHGYRIIEAVDGSEALAKWEAHHAEISLVLTDMILPGGLTGLELIGKIRAERPDLKAIISSGYGPDLSPGAAPALGGISFVAKPCLPRELLAAIRATLDAGTSTPASASAPG